MTIPQDAATVQLAAEGDDRAWVELYARYGGMLTAIGYKFRLNREEVADAVQSTWLLLFENFKNLREPEKLPGWLSSTMRRECIRLANRPRLDELLEELHDQRFVDADNPVKALLHAERDGALWDAIHHLPARQRAIVVALTSTPTPSYAEISRQLSVAVGTIGPTRAKALRTLRKVLTDKGFDGHAGSSNTDTSAGPARCASVPGHRQ